MVKTLANKVDEILTNLDTGKYLDSGGVDKARQDIIELIDDEIANYNEALIDLFTNPPSQVGSAEDLRLTVWDIGKMLKESLKHLSDLRGEPNDLL